MGKNDKPETRTVQQDADGRFRMDLPTRTLVADNGESMMTHLGALREVAAGAEVREDLRVFLEKTAAWPDTTAVYVDKDTGPRVICDSQNRPLGWVPSQ